MSKRTEQIGGIIAKIISKILRDEIRDPRLGGLITITGVDVSKDLRNARVYWSVIGDEEVWREAENGFKKAKGYIQRLVAQRLILKVTPRLEFVPDHTMERAQRIEMIIEELTHKDGE